MSATLAERHGSSLPVRAEKFAKADLRKPEMDYKRLVGQAVESARRTRGWTNDEFAGKVNRDPRQAAKWQSGEERPQFDVLFKIDDDLFRSALVIALARLANGVEIDTVIRLRMKQESA